MAEEFDVGERRCRAKRLPAMTQWYLGAKLAPIVPPIFQVLGKVLTRQRADQEESGVSLFELLEATIDPMTIAAQAISKMPEDHIAYVVSTCLGAIEVYDAGGWHPAMSGELARFPEFKDPGHQLTCVISVVKENLSGFISGLPIFRKGEAQKKESSHSGVSQTASNG